MFFVYLGEFAIVAIFVFIGCLIWVLAPTNFFWWAITCFIFAGIATCFFIGNIILEISRARRKRALQEQKREQLIKKKKQKKPQGTKPPRLVYIDSPRGSVPTVKVKPVNKKPAGKSAGQQKRGK